MRRRACPPQDREELGEHHRRRTPDFDAFRQKHGKFHGSCFARHRPPFDLRGIHQASQRWFDNSRDFAVRGLEHWLTAGRCDDRMQAKTADGDVNGRENAKAPRLARRQTDFLLGLPKRRFVVGFASLDNAARQRHLAAMSIQGLRPNRENNVWLIVEREEQQQSGCMSNTLDGKPGGPVAPRPRGHQRVSSGAREGAGQRNLEPLQDFSKRHRQNKAICGQLDFGAGYDGEVTAFTSSAPSNA